MQKKCKKVAKKFGKGKMFDVSLHRISERGRIWLSLSSRISLVSRSCFCREQNRNKIPG